MKTGEAVRSNAPLPEEARLVHEAQSGDADSFARLYDAYFQRVYRYVYFRVSDDQTAEDLTSQVFLKAWENLSRYKPSSHFLAWLYTIARNQVIDHYRTRKETVPLDEVGALSADSPAVDEQVQLKFELQTMRDALQFLTEDQQEVLILKFIAGLDTREIARQMSKGEGAIRALQMRALQALAKYLETEKSYG
ncbi:MAG: sigma-70 family RNA polymerase sigma factor [Chloroflexi bacterium]|nr:sigma-70 family RNA polymerase sigma factor [Chloroflexota bacterium]MBI3340050.1 sigma-70 family RNA polymerase sigma factor [Chloroflexota bacterium]